MSSIPLRLTTVVLATGLLAACGGSGDPLATGSTSSTASSSGAASGSIVVGSADFSESQLLAYIYAGALQAKGINATTKLNIGAREIYLKALADGSIDVVPEYTGALGFFYDCEHRDCATTWGLTLAYDRPCGCPRVDVSAPGGGVHQAAGRVGSDLIGA